MALRSLPESRREPVVALIVVDLAQPRLQRENLYRLSQVLMVLQAWCVAKIRGAVWRQRWSPGRLVLGQSRSTLSELLSERLMKAG